MVLIFFIAALTVIAAELRRKDSIYRYTLLGPLVFAVFVGFQLIGLNTRRDLPPGGVDAAALMGALCVVMIWLGGSLARRRGMPHRVRRFNSRRLLKGSMALSVIGAMAFFLISRLPDELRLTSLPSGLYVAYSFFAQLLPYGMAIAALLAVVQRSQLAMLIIIFDTALYLDRFISSARRGEAAVAIVIIALALRFGRGVLISRGLFLTALVAGSLFLFSTGDYRQGISGSSPLDAITEIDYLENIAKVFQEGGPEVEVAVYQIAATNWEQSFDLGAQQWNSIVFRYVPAQIIGAEAKAALYFDLPDLGYEVFGFVGQTGSTATGMADAFRSFWFLGSLLFLVIAYVLERMYIRAKQGDVLMQLLYMVMLVNALHAVTHNTSWFFASWIHVAVFFVPVLIYAQRPYAAQLRGKRYKIYAPERARPFFGPPQPLHD